MFLFLFLLYITPVFSHMILRKSF